MKIEVKATSSQGVKKKSMEATIQCVEEEEEVVAVGIVSRQINSGN